MAKKTTTIVDQLREAIEQSGLTAYRLSKETGVLESTLSRFLSGERDIRLETAAAIAEHLGLQLVKMKS
jgi:transcriptional regulator with XRE-family HTH domain